MVRMKIVVVFVVVVSIIAMQYNIINIQNRKTEKV